MAAVTPRTIIQIYEKIRSVQNHNTAKHCPPPCSPLAAYDGHSLQTLQQCYLPRERRFLRLRTDHPKWPITSPKRKYSP